MLIRFQGTLPLPSSVDRFILGNTIIEMLRAYADSHKVCAKQLSEFATANNKKYPMDYLIVEVRQI